MLDRWSQPVDLDSFEYRRTLNLLEDVERNYKGTQVVQFLVSTNFLWSAVKSSAERLDCEECQYEHLYDCSRLYVEKMPSSRRSG